MADALHRRGVEDLDLVQVDVLPSGVFAHPLEAARRFGRAVMYLRRDPLDNAYARPIEHLIAFVDLDSVPRARGDRPQAPASRVAWAR